MPGLTVGCISYKKIGPNTIEMNRFTVDTGMYKSNMQIRALQRSL